ncbi:solute carrier family 1 member 3a isoform X1 [Mugil cephalus]|uniref:solute carrier family 1 member 3a isoform X1 n=1 Tax=Mugil cephalus TaxID=48193 RepID=UPI001FB75BE5|nr:solute carrier family 1 member 3a isoform X1 [Mugil cephalus]XP_047448285.1 solute carrier family 1 member 3a isoform X1 [Mugil cephalus]
MTQSNGENPQRSGLHQIRAGIQSRSLLAKRRVENITKDDVKGFFIRNAFVILTVIAVIFGVILGFSLRPYKMSYREIKFFSFPGELLMRMLQMLVLPLLVSSLITGMAALDSRASGKMGMRAVVYYTTTTIIAVFIGIVMVLIIHPGKGSKEEFTKQQKIEQISAADAFLDLIRNMFPPNIVEACTKQVYFIYIYIYLLSLRLNLKYSNEMKLFPKCRPFCFFTTQFKTQYVKRVIHVTMTVNDTIFAPNGSQEITREEMIPELGTVNGINALGLVVFAICFGLIIGGMREEGQPLKDFFDCLNEAIMRLVAIIMWYAPVGILFLIAGKIVEMDDISSMGGQLGMYTVTVICGLLIHAIIVLPTLYFVITRKNPFVFIGGLLQALITALGTSSSSATLPITFKCLEENNKVDKRVTRFVLPVGATINMDGTALYEALAAIFIAQVNDYDLNFGQILTISITATAASIGAAGIPQAGLVTMVIVLTSVGLPTDDISLIIAVDWFLDRLRTTTNVLGDSIGAGIVEHLSRHELQNKELEVVNSVVEEVDKKPYQLVCQENEYENERPADSETKM